MQQNKNLLPIVSRYYEPALRLIRRHLPYRPDLAPHALTIVLEDIYNAQQLFEGPHLRPLIIQTIQNTCSIIRRLQQLNLLSTGTPLVHPPMHPIHATI